MIGRIRNPRSQSRGGLKVALVLLLLLLVGLPMAGGAAQSGQVNSAGLVIKHGDGSVLYFYVQFSEPEITGTQLLERAGVSIDESPYAGIGQAICRIDGEGCPATDCFCKSFANPAVFWRYHKLGPDGSWVFLPSGPDARHVHNGDVDGWSWSSKDGDLPSVTLAQIAQINGIAIDASPTGAATDMSNDSTPAATPFVTSIQPSASASPVVVGAEVKPSGQTSSVNVAQHDESRSSTPYVWFGVAVLALGLVATAGLLRRRRSRR